MLCSFLRLPRCGADRIVKFNRDVRPILSDKCFGCHGPDAVAKKIPLRLDSEGAAASVVAGGAQAKLIQRITADDKARRMPPVYSGLKLTAAEIETLRLWIAQGAKWQKHWSFIRPERPPLPAVKNAAWPRNPIDCFVLARLEREGLAPSPEAAREALIRRVSLDLTGLPPTPAEVDAFLQDQSPDAYEKVVDRLLASPRYGERMAARWLDAARYADTNGYQYDGERVMWRWRDWVIDAFNRNLPFDQFTLEQIGGRPAAERHARAEDRHRLQPQPSRQHRGRHHSRGVRGRVRRRSRRDDVHGVPGPDARLRALPQSQVRSVHAERVLPGLRLLQQRAGDGPRHQVRQLAAARAGADATSSSGRMTILSRRIGELEDYLRDRASAIEAAQRPWEAALQGRAGTVGSGRRSSADMPKASDGAASAPGRMGTRASRSTAKRYLDAGDAAAFDIDDRFTLSAWIYSDAAPDGSIVTAHGGQRPRARATASMLNHGKVHVNLTSNWDDDAIRVETEEALDAEALVSRRRHLRRLAAWRRACRSTSMASRRR